MDGDYVCVMEPGTVHVRVGERSKFDRIAVEIVADEKTGAMWKEVTHGAVKVRFVHFTAE